jgi:hypothetical protein
MAATIVSRFVDAHKVGMVDVWPTNPGVRYDPRKSTGTTTQYRNYIDLNSELSGMTMGARRNIVQGMLKRLSNPALVAKETPTMMLIFELRLQALVWAFFGGKEFSEVVGRDLSSHPGYDESHTETESTILSGFFVSITNFQQGKIFAARDAFSPADKTFGTLRHKNWILKTSQ